MSYKSLSGIAHGNVYPQTNNDPKNNAPYKIAGNARPVKHYRKGTLAPPGITVTSSKNLISATMDKPGAYMERTYTCIRENGRIITNVGGPNDLTFNPEPATQTKAKVSITCTKGKLVKKVSGANPKCPAGYKKK